MTTTGSTTSIPATTGTAPIGTAPFGTAPTGTGSTGPARRRNRPAPCASPRPPARTERGVGHPLLRIGVTTLGGGRQREEDLVAEAAPAEGGDADPQQRVADAPLGPGGASAILSLIHI